MKEEFFSYFIVFLICNYNLGWIWQFSTNWKMKKYCKTDLSPRSFFAFHLIIFKCKQCNICMFVFHIYGISMYYVRYKSVYKLQNCPTHHFPTSPDDFYRQNWPFLLLDTSLNVGFCQQFLSHKYNQNLFKQYKYYVENWT